MKIVKLDVWVKKDRTHVRVRTYIVNGAEYKLLRDAKAALQKYHADKRNELFRK